ncbi:Ion channel [Mycena sanguinolenta]|uniref:Ion channel n=1 Tax=Mycena sanguinolenta TaxID=230812 RepID=A0A8H6XS87_9AGAR|nr:Ion channel [Mycena sanguinolenta]
MSDPQGEPVFSRKFRSAWQSFKDFIGRDNVLEVSLGLIISSAFTRIVNSLVSDILLPFLSLLPFIDRNMASKFVVLRNGPNPPYNTVAQADDDGAVTLNYGSFIDAVSNFFFIGVTLYAVVQAYSAASKDTVIKHSVKCEYCRKYIPEVRQRANQSDPALFLLLLGSLCIIYQQPNLTPAMSSTQGEPVFSRELRSAWQNFKDFILRDNVLEVSVGLIISNASIRIVNSLVSDVLIPFISLIPFIGHNMASKIVLNDPNAPCSTVAQAYSDSTITLNYGNFVHAVSSFFFIGVTLYAVVQAYSIVSKDKVIKHSVKCQYCKKFIPEIADRCAFCTSWQDGREDQETSALALRSRT